MPNVHSRFDRFFSQPAVVLLLISVLILPAIIFFPFHSDIDIQQVMGFELFRYHGLPYLSTWDSNFPGTILIHATAITLFGNSEIGLHIMDMIIQIGIIIVLYNVSRFWLNKGAALLGCVLYALFYVHGPGHTMSQKDCFATLPILLSIAAGIGAFRNERPMARNMRMLCAGMFVGIAFWIRPTFGIFLVTPFVSLFDLRTRAGLQALAFEALGFGLILVIGLIPFALTHNGLQEIYLATIRYNYEIYSHTFSSENRSPRTWLALGFIAVWALTAFYHKRQRRQSMFRPKSRPEIQFIIVTIVSLLLGIAVMRRFAIYHFEPFFACFMPVLAAVVWEILESFRWPRTGLVVVMVAALVVLYPWKLAETFFSLTHSYSGLVDRFDKNFNAGATGAAAMYIEQHSRITDAVEVASFTPAIRWRIDRPFATRFTTPQPLLTLPPNGVFTKYQMEWRREYLDNIAAPKTKFYVVENATDNTTSVMAIMMTLPGLSGVIEQNYRLDTIIGQYYIYARK